jgi:hypothetical protein
MSRATKATVARRIEEVLRIRLDGAEFWDVLQYIAEKQQAGEEPWKVPDRGKPIAERTVWWYIHKADQLLNETFRKEAGRKRLLRRHQAQRRNLYAKAVNQGDIRAALACLDSEAKLCGLFDNELNRMVEKLAKELAELKAYGNGNPPKTTPADASGSDDAPQSGDAHPGAPESGPGPADDRCGPGSRSMAKEPPPLAL